MTTESPRIVSNPEESYWISRNEAITQQWKFINDWTPQSDLYAIHYGSGVISIMSAITGLKINMYYRNKVKLKRVGHFATYLPLVILPSLFSIAFHRQQITTDIIIQKTKCSVCLEIKAITTQLILSILYPAILGPAACYMLAARFHTCRIPMINYEPKKMWAFHVQTSRPLYKSLPIWIIANSIVAIGVTYFEMENYNNVTKKFNDFIIKYKAESGIQ